MSAMPVQLVVSVSVSCRLPVSVVSCQLSVVSGNGDGHIRAEKRAKDPFADHSLRLSRLLLSLTTDWH
jgi:hypothetical protein